MAQEIAKAVRNSLQSLDKYTVPSNTGTLCKYVYHFKYQNKKYSVYNKNKINHVIKECKLYMKSEYLVQL